MQSNMLWTLAEKYTCKSHNCNLVNCFHIMYLTYNTSVFLKRHLYLLPLQDIPDIISQVGGFIEELEIYDQQLVLMETKELNKLLKKRGVSKRKQKDIKQRRRTLKNR